MRKHRIGMMTAGIALVLAAVLTMMLLTPVLQDKTGRDCVLAMYDKEPDQVDVIFMGSSHMNCGVFPMDLYRETGITSVNQAQSGQGLPLTYWCMEEVIDVLHPKVIVVDLFYLYQEGKQGSLAYMHQTLDNMRDPWIRLKAVLDTVSPRNWEEFLIPFSLYHNRWTELNEGDIAQPLLVTAGADPIFSQGYYGSEPEFELISAQEKETPPSVSLQYIEQMAELCRRSNVQLVLCTVPYVCYGQQDEQRNGHQQQRWYHYMADWAQERNIPMWNMLPMMDEMGFDLQSDMREWNHANYQGGLKITHKMGQLLQQLGLADHRGDAAFEQWNSDLSAYDQWVTDRLADR